MRIAAKWAWAARATVSTSAVLVLAGAMSLQGAALAAGNDEMWEVSTQMDMPGMPAGIAAMPPQRICRDKDPRKETAQRKDMEDCKVASVKESGTRFTVTLTCPRGPVVIDQTYNAARTEYKGTVKMTDGGQEMVMATTGRRIGSCDAQASRREQADRNAQLIAKAEADGKRAEAQVADTLKREEQRRIQSCNKAVETMRASEFGQYGMCHRKSDANCKMIAEMDAKHYPAAKATCAAKIPEFCSRYQTPEGYLKARGNEEAARMCGLDAGTVKASLCPRALKSESLDFLGHYCPAEAKPLAQQHCAGRDYTSRAGGKYAGFCEAYLANADFEERSGARPAARGQAPARAESAAKKEPDATKAAGDAVQQGISKGLDKLKGLFGR